MPCDGYGVCLLSETSAVSPAGGCDNVTAASSWMEGRNGDRSAVASVQISRLGGARWHSRQRQTLHAGDISVAGALLEQTEHANECHLWSAQARGADHTAAGNTATGDRH